MSHRHQRAHPVLNDAIRLSSKGESRTGPGKHSRDLQRCKSQPGGWLMTRRVFSLWPRACWTHHWSEGCQRPVPHRFVKSSHCTPETHITCILTILGLKKESKPVLRNSPRMFLQGYLSWFDPGIGRKQHSPSTRGKGGLRGATGAGGLQEKAVFSRRQQVRNSSQKGLSAGSRLPNFLSSRSLTFLPP